MQYYIRCAKMKLIYYSGLLLHILTILIVNGSRITREEQNGLSQLRDDLDKELYEPYMKTDFYLINFLKAKKNDVSAAAEMLKKAQNWRIRQRMDKILSETVPWNELVKVLPYRADGVDRIGRPIIEVPIGKWDIRKMVVSGKGDLVVGHLCRSTEDAFQKIRLANEHNPNITQWQILFDLSGYNPKQHACLACIPLQIQYMSEYEANYPLRAKTVWIVNAPKSFESLLNILKSVMAPETREGLEIHGFDISEWKSKLDKTIDPSQLLRIFGGTKI